jgi:hypothetical protein
MVSIASLIIVAALGQLPDARPHSSVAEIRRSLNRFDELDIIALQEKAKKETANQKTTPNDVRRSRTCNRLKVFAAYSLEILPPWQDAELALLENISDDASKPYDFINPPPPPKKVFNAYIDKSWYLTDTNNVRLKVWGVLTAEGNVTWRLEEQPQEIQNAYANSLYPYGQSHVPVQQPMPIPQRFFAPTPIGCRTSS